MAIGTKPATVADFPAERREIVRLAAGPAAADVLFGTLHFPKDAAAPRRVLLLLPGWTGPRAGPGDVLVRWTPEDVLRSTAEGKIPRLENWRDALASKAIGLDTLMNLAGLTSFMADQKAMDEHVAKVLAKR